MDSLAKPKNRALFLVSVAVTGAFAGAAVWLFFFAMGHGVDYGPRFRTRWASLRLSSRAARSVFCRTRFLSACWAAC